MKTNKLRTDRELVQLVIDSFDLHFHSGLCALLNGMLDTELLNEEEYLRVRSLFDEEKPLTAYGFGYWWESGNPVPRIDFLNNLLTNL